MAGKVIEEIWQADGERLERVSDHGSTGFVADFEDAEHCRFAAQAPAMAGMLSMIRQMLEDKILTCTDYELCGDIVTELRDVLGKAGVELPERRPIRR